MQLRPATRAGAEHNRRTDFRLCPSVITNLPALPIAHRGVRAVIDLGLVARRGLDHHASFRRSRSAELLNEALDALIAGGETVAVDQVLSDRHGIATTRRSQFDDSAIGLASAGRGTATRLRLRRHSIGGPAPKSVVTSIAGFDGSRRPHAPGGGTAIPAAFRYPAARFHAGSWCSLNTPQRPF